MVNGTKSEKRSFYERFPKIRLIAAWISRYAAIEIAVFLALAIAAYFLGRNLLDTTVPGEGDVRSHIFKIQLLRDYLVQFSWPQWNPFWYHGIPEDQFYPPGFYFISAVLSFVTRNVVIAYKVMMLVTMALNGLAIFYFARRFLKFSSHMSIWALIAFITSTPLLINFMYGEGPNLFGWSITIVFLTIYLSQVMENKVSGLMHILLPGAVLGVAILVHPFPVIFAAMVIIIFHAVWLIHHWRDWRSFIRYQITYLAGVAVVGALVGMYYWLPAMLTLNYSSPIYAFTKFMWMNGTIYLLAIIFLALTVTIITRIKIRGDVKLDAMLVSFCVACALGFGATSYLPFGLGSLVQEFRFATIIIPFWGILLILYPLKYKVFQLSTARLAIAVCIGVFLTAFVFSLNQREGFAADFSALTSINWSSIYQVIAKQFGSNFPGFAVTMLPYFAVILFLALSLRRGTPVTAHSYPGIVLAGGVCLLLLTTFIPYTRTDSSNNLSRLYKYVDNYEQPGYAQIMSAAKGGRMVVPMAKGFLVEGDNPVTFGLNWGVETVNGPYNQGDPKFFDISVHLEWEERWFNYEWTRENLMQESAAKYIFIRDSLGLPNNLNGMTTSSSNAYGKLLALNQTVARAVAVTPVLVDSKSIREITEFFNILLPQGYKLVLVDSNNINPELKNKFQYVMVDDESKINNYAGKQVFVLKDSTSPSITENQGIVRISAPYLNYTNRIFYHGDIANGYMWLGWDGWPGAQITSDMETVLKTFGNLITTYISKMDYKPVNYAMDKTTIDLGNSPGFTLVKDSYFPYWKSNQSSITSTSQGFMLVYSDSANNSLNYKKPLYYMFAAAFSVLGLIAMSTILLVRVFTRRSKTMKIN